MTEKDPEELADELEKEADALERRSEELHEKVQEAQQDWERKRADPGVPGAPPKEDADEGRSESSEA